MPHLNKMLLDLKSKGFDIITVNAGDSAAVVSKYWKDNQFAMRAAIQGDKVTNQYKVEAIPTNYVIGSDGKILGAFEGYDPDGIKQALAKAGLK